MLYFFRQYIPSLSSNFSSTTRPDKKLCSCWSDLSYGGSATQNICSNEFGIWNKHPSGANYMSLEKKSAKKACSYLESIVDSIQCHTAKICEHAQDIFLKGRRKKGVGVTIFETYRTCAIKLNCCSTCTLAFQLVLTQSTSVPPPQRYERKETTKPCHGR